MICLSSLYISWWQILGAIMNWHPTNANACAIWDSLLFMMHPCGFGKGCYGVHSFLLYLGRYKVSHPSQCAKRRFSLNFGVPPAGAKELCANITWLKHIYLTFNKEKNPIENRFVMLFFFFLINRALHWKYSNHDKGNGLHSRHHAGLFYAWRANSQIAMEFSTIPPPSMIVIFKKTKLRQEN